MSTIIAVFNQKGGVGKTSAVANLAHALSRKYGRVLVIDSDPQYSVSQILGQTHPTKMFNRNLSSLYIDPKVQLEQVIEETRPPPRAAKSSISDVPLPYYGLIYGASDLEDVDLSIGSMDHTKMDPARALAKKLRRSPIVTGFYDVILIDLPPRLGYLPMNGLYASDYVLIPVDMSDAFGFDTLPRALKMIEAIQDTDGAGLKIMGVLRNRYKPRELLTKGHDQQLTEMFKLPVLNTIIPRNAAIAQAMATNETVQMYDKTSTGASAFVRLGQEIATIVGLTSEETVGDVAR